MKEDAKNAEILAGNSTPTARKTGMARLWELAGTKKVLIFFACVFSVVSVIMSFVPFIAIYGVIQELITHMNDLSSLNIALMHRYGWVALISAVLTVFISFIAMMFSHFAAFKTLYKLKLDFTKHIASLPLGFFTENATGKLRKIVDENIEKLETFIAHQLPDIVGSLATPIIVIVFLLVIDWRMGLAALVGVILAYLVQLIAYGNEGAQKFMKQYQDCMEEMNSSSVEYVRGISVIKAFNQTIYSFRKFHATIREYTKFVLEYTKKFATHMGIFMVLVNYLYLFVTPVAILLLGGTIDYGRTVLSVIFYLIFCMASGPTFLKLMYVSSGMVQINDGIARMDKVLDEQPLAEPVNPKTTEGTDIVFENVHFTYKSLMEEDAAHDNEIAEALAGVSFTAKPGEVTALVGPSGSGKSTIAHLIPRFYDVDDGSISIGGVDIRDMKNAYLMQKVSFVFQDVFLFKLSIQDNIKMGNPHATDEQVIAAAKAAQCHDFIEKLPDGYNTVIGTNNIHLSGGEKQRLVIARAILKDAPIIILDEATAFADPENEHKIQKAFEVLMKDKTVIIIAHRLSTVRGANNILVIDQGKVAEQGTHDELLANKGRYSKMWNSYVGAMTWGIKNTASVTGGANK